MVSSSRDKVSNELASYYSAIVGSGNGGLSGWMKSKPGGSASVTIKRTVRDLEGNKARSFVSEYEFDGPSTSWTTKSAFPLELNGIAAYVPSPSGNMLAIVKEAGDKDNGGGGSKDTTAYVIEIWRSASDGAPGGLLHRIPTSTTHGKMLAGGFIGGFVWSPDESQIAYVAQKPPPPTRSHFSTAPAAPTTVPGETPKPTPKVGTVFDWKEDWGERYEGVSSVGIYVADIQAETVVEVQGVEEGLTPGQPRWGPGGRLLYVGWPCEPRKLGMIYCYQRPCSLYAVNTKEWMTAVVKSAIATTDGEPSPALKEDATAKGKALVHTCLTPDDRLAQSPRVSGDTLVWLSRKEGFDTHCGAFRLESASLSPADDTPALSQRRTLVDVVDNPSRPGVFPGLWAMELPEQPWNDGTFFCTTEWGSAETVVCASLSDKQEGGEGHAFGDAGTVAKGQPEGEHLPKGLTRLSNTVIAKAVGADTADTDEGHPSVSFLAAGEAGVLVTSSAPNSRGGFALVTPQGKVIGGPPLGSVTIQSAIRVSEEVKRKAKAGVAGMTWRVIRVAPTTKTNKDVDEPPFECILVMPPKDSPPVNCAVGDEKKESTAEDSAKNEGGKVPLVVMPHGGPHGCMPTCFLPTYAFSCVAGGYALLHVNFRGSTGFGESPLNSLPGHIGKNDVSDVLEATKAACAAEPRIDSSRIGITGGSHGGFLTCHLTAQHPEVFKCAAARNPVTNLASMASTSDIPDWIWVEGLGIGGYDFTKSRPPTVKELERFMESSPSQHVDKVKAPTLMALGLKDKRVPFSQGLEWHNTLRANKVPARLLTYPEDVHGIDKPQSEADYWVNHMLWFGEHL